MHNVVRKNGEFIVETQNDSYIAKRVVLALGRRGTARRLGVPGEDQAKVMYKLMDAETYTRNHLLIVGGGDSAAEAALGLARQQGNTITLSYRKDNFFRLKKRNDQHVKEMIKAGKIRVIYNSKVIRINKASVALETKTGQIDLPNDYTFIFAGGEPPFKILKQIGIAFGGEQKVAV